MKLLSVLEAANLKGVRRETVHRAIHAGKVNAQRVGRSWVVIDDDRFLEYQPGTRGRPRIHPRRCPECGRSVVAETKDSIPTGMCRCIRCKRRWTEEQLSESAP